MRKIGLVFCITVMIIVVDVVVFKNIFGFGYKRDHEQENIQRYPSPYVEFIGR